MILFFVCVTSELEMLVKLRDSQQLNQCYAYGLTSFRSANSHHWLFSFCCFVQDQTERIKYRLKNLNSVLIYLECFPCVKSLPLILPKKKIDSYNSVIFKDFTILLVKSKNFLIPIWIYKRRRSHNYWYYIHSDPFSHLCLYYHTFCLLCSPALFR